MRSPPPTASLFPYTTLFRSCDQRNSFFKTPADEPTPPVCIDQDHDDPDKCRHCLLLFHSMSLAVGRSEEHTSELQSRGHLVCRLLLEKKQTSAETLLRTPTS